MSWRQFVRAMERQQAAQRRWQAAANTANARAERASMQRYRAMLREQRTFEKEQHKLQAAHEVEQFETYLDLLVSLHKQSSTPVDWRRLATIPPPPAPEPRHDREVAARAAQAVYRPGLVDRLFGGANRERALLEQGCQEARAADHAIYLDAIERHRAEHAAWAENQAMARRIVGGEVRAYGPALGLTGVFDELAVFQTQVEVVAAAPDAMVLVCTIGDDELVPREEVKLTSTGKLTTKAMAQGRYWLLYQDHVCSAALRVALEVFAVLPPMARAVVNVGTASISLRTGHPEHVTLLAVHLTRDGVGRLDLSRIDPSEAMKNFPHRMKFKKTAGMDPVEAMTLDDNWITTG